MGFWVFLNFWSKGEAKNFQLILKGGLKITTRREDGGEKFSIFDFLENLGKIKGHVKNLLLK